MRTENKKLLKRNQLNHDVPPYWRPTSYTQCQPLPRPCPYVGCRYHLMLEAKDNGSITYYFQDLDEMENTCALDVAQTGSKSEEELAVLFHLEQTRIRQLQQAAIKKMQASLPTALR